MGQRDEQEALDQQIREVSKLVQSTLSNMSASDLRGGETGSGAARFNCFGTFGTWTGTFGTFGSAGVARQDSGGTRRD